MKTLLVTILFAILFLFCAAPQSCIAAARTPAASPLELTVSISKYRAVDKPIVPPPGKKPLPLELAEAVPGTDGIPVMAGEPLILNYRLTNKSTRSVSVNLGKGVDSWLIPILKDSNGLALRSIPYHHPTDEGGAILLHDRGWHALAPDDAIQGKLILTRKFAIRSAGSYVLHVALRIPWYDGIQENMSLGDRPPETTGTATPAIAMTLRASPPSLRKQEILARQLLEQALAVRAVEPVKVMIQAIFTMQESAALPAWETLCDRMTTWNMPWVIEELSRLSTPASASLLGRIAGNSHSVLDIRHIALGRLRAMYIKRDIIGNPALDAVVVNLLKELDGTLPPLELPRLPPGN